MAFSLGDNHISVNYHYVEDLRDDARGIHPCSVAEFERQIVFLAKHYRFVSIPHVFDAAQKGLQEKLCAITFDDGLQDQWDNALPILKQYGVLATFFIITGTLDDKIPSAHKIHMVLSRISMPVLVEKFNLFLSHDFPDLAQTHHIPSDHYLNDKRRHDDIPSANFKEMLNNIAPRNVSAAFLSLMLTELGMREDEECGKLFMTAQEIFSLQDQGFFVETHTHNHYSLEREPVDVLRKDFHEATDALTSILGKSPHVMAYPYGRPPGNHTILSEHGIAYGVTVENKAIIAGNNPLLIPRFDTNDIRDFLNGNG